MMFLKGTTMNLHYNGEPGLRKAMAEFSRTKPNFAQMRDRFKEEQKAAHKRLTEQTSREHRKSTPVKLVLPALV